MRHLIALIAILTLSYVVWVLVPRPARTRMLLRMAPHMRRLLAILVVLLVGIVAAFYTPSVRIL